MDIIRKRKRDDTDGAYKRLKVIHPFNSYQTTQQNQQIEYLQYDKLRQINEGIHTKYKELNFEYKKLKKMNYNLKNDNQCLQNEISTLKNALADREVLNDSLQKHILDIHRHYFIENTPIESDCSYLS